MIKDMITGNQEVKGKGRKGVRGEKTYVRAELKGERRELKRKRKRERREKRENRR